MKASRTASATPYGSRHANSTTRLSGWRCLGSPTATTTAPTTTSCAAVADDHTTTAFDRLIDALRDHGSTVKETGQDKATAQCPAHDDSRASLSVGPRHDDKGTVVYCHAGCQTDDIVAALGLPMSDLFDDPQMRAAYNGHNIYDYPDGRQVHRRPGKQFHQSGNTKGTALFHADRIGDAETVYIPEGERTCWPSKPSALQRSARRWAQARHTKRTGHRYAAST